MHLPTLIDATNEREVEFVFECPFCHKKHSVLLDNDDATKVINDYYQGSERIQDVLPNVANESREAFISGICLQCLEQLFGKEFRI